MLVEVFGFLAGLSIVAGAAVAFFQIENGRSIAAAYRREARPGRGGNALIWPSR